MPEFVSRNARALALTQALAEEVECRSAWEESDPDRRMLLYLIDDGTHPRAVASCLPLSHPAVDPELPCDCPPPPYPEA